MKGNFTFSKEEKLTGKTCIDQLFDQGRSFNLSPLKVFYIVTDNPAEPAARLLIAVPKKKVKRAVDRNRMRRRIREAYRLNKAAFLEALPVHIHFALIYMGDRVDIPYKEVEMKLTACLAKLQSSIASESEKGIH